MPTPLTDLSIYHLLVELLYDGKANLYSTLEPIATEEIVRMLNIRSGKAYGCDKGAWVTWFTSEEESGLQDEKNYVAMLKILLDMENHKIALVK